MTGTIVGRATTALGVNNICCGLSNHYGRVRNDHKGMSSDYYKVECGSSVAVWLGNFVFRHPLHNLAMDKAGSSVWRWLTLKKKLEQSA